MINVHTSGNPSNEAAKALIQLLATYAERDILLLFSGGSSLTIVDHLHPKYVPKNTTISVLDERYSTDTKEGNFALLENTTFLRACMEKGIQTIDPRPQEHESLFDTAKRFDIALKHWHITHQNGVVIATVGVGSDIHTAGVLPMTDDPSAFEGLFLNSNKCAVGHNVAPERNPHGERITVTLSYFLRHIHHAVVYATGIQKKEALEAMLHATPDYSKMPATVLQNVAHAELFTDISL